MKTTTTATRTIDTHNLPMHGLRKAVSAIRCWGGAYPSFGEQVSYDRQTGDVLIETVSYGWRVQYRDPAIISLGTYCGHVTMQQLADDIAHAVKEADQRAEWGY